MLEIELSLLAAVQAAPNEDAPRLVLADWLQERGSPWGEFIAVQCQLAHETRPTEARATLLRREQSLLERRSEWWPYDGAGFKVTSFARGFPRTIQAGLARGRPWFPDVDDIEIPVQQGDMQFLAELGRLPTRGLTLSIASSYRLTLDDARLFANWRVKNSPSLRRFGIRGRATGASLRAAFDGLDSLEDVLLESLQTSVPWIESPLRRFTLRNVSFTGFDVFMGEGLEEVELSYIMLERRAPDVVDRLPKVEHLNLRSTGLDEVGLDRILDRAPPTLRSLIVSGNRLGDAAVERLATKAFECLDLSSNQLTPESARILLASSTLPPTLDLTVDANDAGDHLEALRERFAVVHTR